MKLLSLINRRRNQRGQVIVLASLAIVVLIGFAGLVIDLGNIYTTRRRMQTAADAAAIAAANTLQSSDSSDYSSAAQSVASLNGFTDSANGVTVTVGSASSCPNASGQQCVQVTVAQTVPTYFLKVLNVLGYSYNTINVQTEAIAGTTNNPACIYALDPSDSESLSIGSPSQPAAFTFSASCGAIVDSTSSSGLYLNGAGSFTTTGTGVGGSGYHKSGAITMKPAPVTNAIAANDPLASLVAPTFSSCTPLSTTTSAPYKPTGSQITIPANTLTSGGISVGGAINSLTFPAGNYGNNISLSGAISNATFNPGQYQGGTGSSSDSIDISGAGSTSFETGTYTFCGRVSISGANTITLSPGVYQGGISITGAANITFNPGTYILAGGGFTVSNSAAVIKGTGVTFYNTTGPSGTGFAPFAISGASSSSLSAPTTGTYKGILFFTDRSIAAGTAGYTTSGASTITTDGVWYFPTTAVQFNGSSSSSGYTSIVAYQINFGSGTESIGADYSSLGGASPISSSTLYE
jgi:Flp pilus assembly protein TadG